jgi:catechol 2,3-dioxygenase-like lactoylglutathione lyase family enzyme
MSSAALDHVGVVARDLAAVAEQYERLGFTLTPFARQADGRIGNRCAMLRHGYLELLAVADPNAGSATLERFLARYTGIHILAFAFEDESAVLARLRRAGIASPSVTRFDRPIDDADPAGPRARFAIIQLPDQPEGRINLVHHLTPEALWQERFLHHPNNAASLAEVAIVVSDPADAAARFSRLVGCHVVPDPVGGFALALARGSVRLLPDTAQQSISSNGAITALPRIVGLTVRTTDGNNAITNLLADRSIAHRRAEDALLVDADAAGGVALRFVPAA